jgi:sugar phosphate isomerase/epimerase
MKRRKFLQSGAMLTASTFIAPSLLAQTKSRKDIGLQLYSLRDVIFKDTKNVLKQVASFGYTELETFAYDKGMLFGMTLADFSKYCNDLGMKVVSGHYSLDQATGKDWEKMVAEAKAINQNFVVVPWIDAAIRNSIDLYKRHCESLNKAGEVANAYGIRLAYHNHDFEFQAINGLVPYDVMLKELDPRLVTMELDLYWVVYAGYQPADYFQKYPGRFELWHVKDMDKSDRKRNADVGTGTIDFKSLFAKAGQSGLKKFFIEQETYPTSSIESIKACAANMAKII